VNQTNEGSPTDAERGTFIPGQAMHLQQLLAGFPLPAAVSE
jgi:hypothetical protein